MKDKILNLLRAFISLFLIGMLFWLMRDRLPGMHEILIHADRGLLFYGFAVCLATIYFIALRLKKVISVQSIDLSVSEAVHLSFVGYFFNNFLPTSFGGDFLKAYYAGKKSNRTTGAFAGVFMDRILAMIPFTLIPVITITFFSYKISNRGITVSIYFIFFASTVLVWMLLHKGTARYLVFLFEPFKKMFWYEKIKNCYDFLNMYSRHKIVLLWSLFLSIIAQVLSIISVYIFAKALGADSASAGVFFAVVPIVWIMTLIPSLNGLGIREGAFVYLLSPYMPSEKAFAVSILVLASLVLYSVIGGFIYSFQKSTFSFKTRFE
jgi:glycosyltransferase 2 family protein